MIHCHMIDSVTVPNYADAATVRGIESTVYFVEEISTRVGSAAYIVSDRGGSRGDRAGMIAGMFAGMFEGMFAW